ncbi:MAG TPA: sulfite exporter TauE/SafE family protein [Polyangiaceae bacterium]
MIDPTVALAGLFVGFVVGLTGMGGGALMTPILVLLFKVQPLVAVSSDIVAAMVMKPVGGGVHWRRGTVNTQLVGWLMLGSVPSAFLGVLLLKASGTGAALQERVKLALGLALLVVAAGLIIRPLLTRGRQAGDSMAPLLVKKLPTVLIGIAGGLVVGLTSVGSGSLMMILLLMLYPKLRLSELVGTDLVQAIPLVASAALGHAFFGDFKLALTASILVGSLPGVFIGAQLSSRAPDAVIRPALIVVLLGSSLKLLGTSNLVLGLTLLAFVGAYFGVQRLVRANLDLPAKAQKASV